MTDASANERDRDDIVSENRVAMSHTGQKTTAEEIKAKIRQDAAECEHDWRPRFAAFSAGAVEEICVECGATREVPE